jgi:hypothetical protein
MRGLGHDVTQIDLSAELTHHMLDPDNVARWYALGRSRRQLLRLRMALLACKGLLLGSKLDFSAYRKMEKDGAELARLATGSKKTLAMLRRVWSPSGYVNLDKDYKAAVGAATDALAFASRVLPGWSIEMAKGTMNLSPRMFEEDPFDGYYRQQLIPKIRAMRPNLLAISMTYLSQLAFTLTLLHALRSAGIDCPFVTGGSAFSIICRMQAAVVERNVADQGPWKYLMRQLSQPFGIRDEGEIGFASLCRALETGGEVTSVPNLVRRDGTAEVVMNPIGPPPSADQFPEVSFDGLPVGLKYLSPRPFLPLLTSRGCYWRKCAFCEESSGQYLKDDWREIPHERIVANLERLERAHGALIVNFCDRAMSPRMVRALSEQILDRGLHVQWGTMVRFDAPLGRHLPLAARAGCSYFGVGMESACQRVLDRMKKGYHPETVQRLIDECAGLGIRVHLSIIFGFPGETRDEARKTIQFITRNSHKVFSLLSNPWWPQIGSDVVCHPEAFGVSFGEARGSGTCSPIYSVDSGLTHDEAQAIHREFMNDPLVRDKLILGQREFLPDEHRYLLSIVE